MRLLRRLSIVVLLMLCFLPLTFAQNPIFNSETLLINQTISTQITIENSHYLNWLEANFSFLPVEDYRQEVVSRAYTPQPYKREIDHIIYRFARPKKTIEYESQSIIRTKAKYKPVTGKVNYPLSSMPSDTRQYLQETELVDINDEIRQLAKELAGDSDDLFEISFKVADWVTSNIEYDLNTITADASQKASWVLDARSGVCDELSTLYMALMRSLGIPTRFVVGVSYSDSPLFAEPWQAHAWTEVYFPDYGWVPFDLTYNQFGYIDATHIKLKTSNDGDETTTYYKWEGTNLKFVSVDLNELSFNQEILNQGGAVDTVIEISSKLLTPKAGKNSHGLIEIKLENTKPHYASNTIFVQSSSEVTVEKSHPILLRPLQTTYMYIPFKITNDLQDNTLYTIPIVVSDLRGFLESNSLEAHERYEFFEEKDIEDLKRVALAEHQAGDLLDISIGCKPDSLPVFVNRTTHFTCEVDGAEGNFEVCLFDTCQTSDLGTYHFNATPSRVGELSTIVELYKDEHSMVSRVDFPVTDIAKIQIQNLTHAQTLKYEDALQIEFTIGKESFASPENVRVGFQADVPSSWNLGTLNTDNEFKITVPGDQLVPGENTLIVIVEYFDGEFNQRVEEEVIVDLVDVPIFTRMWLWILYVFR